MVKWHSLFRGRSFVRYFFFFSLIFRHHLEVRKTGVCGVYECMRAYVCAKTKRKLYSFYFWEELIYLLICFRERVHDTLLIYTYMNISLRMTLVISNKSKFRERKSILVSHQRNHFYAKRINTTTTAEYRLLKRSARNRKNFFFLVASRFCVRARRKKKQKTLCVGIPSSLLCCAWLTSHLSQQNENNNKQNDIRLQHCVMRKGKKPATVSLLAFLFSVSFSSEASVQMR